MKILILILGLSAIYAAPTQTDCGVNSLCTDKTEGRYPYGPDSTYFYTCDDNINTGCQKCGAENLHYSKKCDACLSKIDAENGNCPNKPDDCAPVGFCNDRPKGAYQSPDDKQKFFTCMGDGVATFCQTCQEFLVYSEACGQCLGQDIKVKTDCPNFGQTTSAPAEQCSPTFCVGREDGDYEKAENSQKFYACASGLCFVKTCPSENVFVKVCNSRCEMKYTKNELECPGSFPEPTGPTNVCSPKEFCVGQPDGNYQKNINLREKMFYQCANAQCFVQNCPGALVYNPAGYCDFA